MTTRPNALQYIAYSFGHRLPDSLCDWVRNDLTGDLAVPRHLFRSMIPFLPIFAGIYLLLPGSSALRGATVLLPVLLALVYSTAPYYNRCTTFLVPSVSWALFKARLCHPTRWLPS